MKPEISHDQLLKELVKAFFQELMELFLPKIASRLDFTRVTILDTETFTDVMQGDRRDADIVAQVYTLDGKPEIILAHFEIEVRRRGVFPERMFEYYMVLTLRHHLDVFPIAIYLSPGAGGLVTEQHVKSVFDTEVNVFKYNAIGLPDLEADDYLYLDNPLGPALSSIMRPSKLGSVVQKYHAIRAIALSRLDEARKALLTNFVETYSVLSSDEKLEFEQLVSQPEGKEVREMVSVYEERGVLRGKREALLRLLHQRFGDLPTAFQLQLESVSDSNQLDGMFDRVITAKSLEEMVPTEQAH